MKLHLQDRGRRVASLTELFRDLSFFNDVVQ